MRHSRASTRKKLLFVVTEDWYFCSHRLPLAKRALEAGFDVAIATRITNHGDLIRTAGIEIHSWDVSRGSTSIFGELKTLLKLARIYWRVKPDLVHQVALKPVLYGSFIAKLLGRIKVVNALGGMGFVFNRGKSRARRLRGLILTGCKWLLSGRGSVLILQNPDDQALMIKEAGVDPQNIQLVRGAGVNVEEFSPTPEPSGIPLVVLPGRMLWDKGISEYVEAAKSLEVAGVRARFALVGGIDESNPTAVPREQLEKWVAQGTVEWFGLRNDMPEVLRQANIVCLPSYREGLPKSLLEAAASARAIVATDVPGCREIVRDGKNGILVPACDSEALAAALEKLIVDAALRKQMGQNGREMILNEFSEEIVVRKTINIYKDLVAAMS